ncbi:MAG TPA: DUF2510 domain-containing protein [Ilumatobacteraceae bacterium]|nr:DUF2510 domain-containing protein [Ilumatobacteraceae bacterium]
MTWPTGPPPMPPSGWYDDPEHPWTWRYWDGARWSDHRAPMWVPPARDPSSFSSWFERSVAAVKVAVRRVGVLLVGVWLLFGIAGWWSVVSSFDSDRGRELRRLLDIEGSLFGGSTVTLTDAEADRAWELVQDIFWSALPWIVLLGVGFVLLAAWSVALVVRAVQPHLADPATGGTPAEPLGAFVGAAVRRVPAVVGSGIVVFLVFAGVWIVAWLPVVFVALIGGGGAAIVLTVVFVLLLVVVAMAWLWVRLALASVIAAAGGVGIGVKRSWELTHGQFWYAAGRLIITGLIAGAAGGVINSVTGFGSFLGFVAYVSILFALQAVAFAVSIVVTVSGNLVTIGQLDDRTEPG